MLSTIEKKLQLGLLFLSLIFINASCDPTVLEGEGGGGQVFLDSIPATKEAQRHFYHAWLADCDNEEFFLGKEHALKELSKQANDRVRDAVTNKAMIDYFGHETMAWGPVLSVSYIEESGDKYTTDNLLYCLQRMDTLTGTTHFMVGIAGTNGISSYDWLHEDFDASSQKEWDNGGKISNGSQLGMNNLTGFKVGGVTIDSFLRKEARMNPNMAVEVSGHSLGGAQTQTMASFLKGRLKTINPNIPVSGWAYAGPTAGNGEFADSLVAQIDGYYAYNNTLDVVPHAWVASELNELCTIYDGFAFCKNTMESNVWRNGLIKYLSASSAGGDYTHPTSYVPSFTGQHFFPAGAKGCDAVYDNIHTAWRKSGEPINLYYYLNKLGERCGHDKDIIRDEFYQFSYFLAQLGSQHLTPYFDHFLKGTPLYTALPQYVPGNSGTDVEWDAADVLSSFVEEAEKYLDKHGISDCDCQTSTSK
jgi:hypothetical protein